MQEELPGSTFVKLGRLLRTSFGAEFRALFGDEISPGDARIMAFIKQNPGTSQKEICLTFELTKSTGSEMIASLINNGFVEVRTNPQDKRGKELFLTPKGVEMEGKAKKALIEHDKRLFAEVSEEELLVVKGVYEKVTEKMKGEKDGK